MVKFNKSQPQPDAEDTDVIDGFSTSTEAGFRLDWIDITAASCGNGGGGGGTFGKHTDLIAWCDAMMTMFDVDALLNVLLQLDNNGDYISNMTMPLMVAIMKSVVWW